MVITLGPDTILYLFPTTAINCVVLSAVSCSELNSTNARTNSTSTQYGAVVNVTCDPGYEYRYVNQRVRLQLAETEFLYSKHIIVVCTASGQWSINNTACQRMSCLKIEIEYYRATRTFLSNVL